MIDRRDRPLGLLGAGGHAREIASFAGRPIAFSAVEAAYLGDGLGLVDIAAPGAADREVEVVGAVGAPGLRRKLVGVWPGRQFASVVAMSAHVGEDSVLGAACVIAPHAVVTTNCSLGAHTHLNVGSTVNHDARIGAYVTIAPGAHVGGNCTLGDGVWVGIGAIVSHGVTLASGVVLGAGAVVVADVTRENAVLAGVPAREVRVAEDWLHEL